METITDSITLKKLKRNFADSILEVFDKKHDYDTVLLKKEELISAITFLKDDKELDYNILMDIVVVDYLKYPVKKTERFEVVYNLYSLTKNHRILLKCPVSIKDPNIDSISHLWKAANWGERECFDQFGINFINHPNLKRILNHHEFIGHPLRKDYPIKKRQTLSVNDSLMDEMDKRLKVKGLK